MSKNLAPPYYHCFIAYSSNDRAVALQLYHSLVSEGLLVFLDVLSINPGDMWDVKIQKSQQKALATLVLVSNKSRSSHYIKEEISEAIHLSIKIGQYIIPIYLDGKGENYLVPYGLRRINGLFLNGNNDIKNIASTVSQIIHKLDISSVINQNKSLSCTAKIGSILKDQDERKPNFQYMLDKLEEIHAIALESSRSSSLIFFDIDGMTQINKVYGKDAGNLILVEIEEVSRDLLESRMDFYKFGTDEYICLGMDIDMKTGIEIASSLCDAISSYEWNTIAQDLRVTASFGVANLKLKSAVHRKDTSKTMYNETANEWILRAIFGSRNAKKKGGNRIEKGPLILRRNISRKLKDYLSD